MKQPLPAYMTWDGIHGTRFDLPSGLRRWCNSKSSSAWKFMRIA